MTKRAKSKSEIMVKLAKKRKLKVVNYRLKKRKPSDVAGIPNSRAWYWRDFSSW